MEPKFQTSFIPKNPVIATRVKTEASSISLFSVLTIIIFIGALIFSAYIFLSKKFVSKSLEEAKASLDLERESFDKGGIDELILVSNQIKSVKILLDKHIAVSNLFVLLESLTIPNTSFIQLTFDGVGDGIVSVSINARSTSYAHLARQSDILKNSEFIKKVSMFGLNKDEDNLILAKIDLNIDSKTISYKEAIEKLLLVPNIVN